MQVRGKACINNNFHEELHVQRSVSSNLGCTYPVQCRRRHDDTGSPAPICHSPQLCPLSGYNHNIQWELVTFLLKAIRVASPILVI